MSSSYSREATAKFELDKAEKEIFENAKDFEDLFKFLQGAAKGGELANSIYTLSYDTNTKDLLQKYMKAKANGEVSSVEEFFGKKYKAQKWAKGFGFAGAGLNFKEELSKGNTMRAVVGAVADVGLIFLPKFIKGSNPILIAIDIANIIDKATLDTGLFDISNHLKNLYDKLTGSRDGRKIEITDNGVLQVTMPNGEVYARPLIDTGSEFSLFGDGKDDVLFGGSGDDLLQGRNGDDLLLGGSGYDTYFVDDKDTIRDDGGKGRVFLSSTNIQLTGGTQIEKGSKIYKSKDGIKYELKGSDLIINDNITIENFSKISNDLGIVLVDVDDIVVTIGNNQSTEGGNGKHSMEFKITLNRALKEDENLSLLINGQIIKFSPNDIEQTYTYEWEGNETKDEDRKFEVGGFAMINGTSENLNVQAIISGQGLIKDDDKDPNDDKPETYDPLVIDLNNDGIKGTNLDYKINFDLDNNGFKEATSWIDNNDAFIAIDKNNNGTIDNGSELFGNKSISNNAYAYTNPNAKNGFESLKEFDSNNDGIIDEKDKEFTNLLLWQDKNSNGISETDELIKLSDKAEFTNLNLLIA